MQLNEKVIKKIEFSVDKGRFTDGTIELFAGDKISLKGKLEIINNHSLVDGWYAREETDRSIFNPPIKFSVISQFMPPISAKQNSSIPSNFLEFWKSAKVFWFNISYFQQKLTIRFTGAVGNTYGENKSDDIDIRIDLKKAEILEALNVPGLKDVRK